MKFDFYEGPAGTGKTHSLVRRAEELVQNGVLDDGQKVLALTFMNGARRRLEARMGAKPVFHRRFLCQTFDVFARTLATRHRSRISAPLQDQAAMLNTFDGPCFLAASLLEIPAVQQWVARGFPLVVVDEAQDLDEYRLGILQGLSASSSVVAAADAFQCLTDSRDTAGLIKWLESAGQVHRLAKPERTRQQGLLAVARAVRQGRNICSYLTERTFRNRSTWIGAGIRLLEVPATKGNHGLLSWSIANEIAQRHGAFAILTPDSTNPMIRGALSTVQTKQWKRKNGVVFGPYSLRWDRDDQDEADALLARISIPEVASFTDLREILAPLTVHLPIAQAIKRMDRLRRVQGRTEFSADHVEQLIHECVRNQSRLGLQKHRGHLAMTIQRAKNREFPNVVVLWPHSATGSPEHLRRLLYNAITRAIKHCSVIVLGQGRLNAPPFAPGAL